MREYRPNSNTFQCVNFMMKSFNYSQDDTLKENNGIGRGLNCECCTNTQVGNLFLIYTSWFI